MRFSNPGAGIALSVFAAGTVAALLTVTAWAAPVESGAPAVRAESAVWTPRELSFVYQGFTTTYSCDGLRDRVRSVLLKLGAREDLQVSESPCVSLGRPDPFPGVRIKMNVLQPGADRTAPTGNQSVPAHWKTIDLTPEHDAVSAAGDCELVEQVKQSILPLFATRNVEYSSNCVPHQLQMGATRLRAEVLVPDQKNAKPTGARLRRALADLPQARRGGASRAASMAAA
jgi:hypothetical protein